MPALTSAIIGGLALAGEGRPLNAVAGVAKTAIATISEPITGAKKKRKESERVAKEQEDKQLALEEETRLRGEQEESTATAQAAGKKARKRQKAQSAGVQGRRGTLLTGPLGLVGEPETAGKTLIGA